MAEDAEIYREAMRVIQGCGTESNPKDYAFTQSSLFHEHGNMKDAERWARIANAIDFLLEDITEPIHLPTALH